MEENIVKKDKKGLFHIPYKTRVPSFQEFIKAPDKFTKPQTAANSDKLYPKSGDKDTSKFTKNEFVNESQQVNEGFMEILDAISNVDFSVLAEFGKELWSWLVGIFTDPTPAGGGASGMTVGQGAQIMASMFTGAGLTVWRVIRKVLRSNKQTANLLEDALDLSEQFPEVNQLLDKLMKSSKGSDIIFAKKVKLQLENEESPLRKLMKGADYTVALKESQVSNLTELLGMVGSPTVDLIVKGNSVAVATAEKAPQQFRVPFGKVKKKKGDLSICVYAEYLLPILKELSFSGEDKPQLLLGKNAPVIFKQGETVWAITPLEG